MTECFSFPPSIDGDSTVLILGSMPGVRSLELQQYYAHPQNRFWKLMGQLLDYPLPDTEYQQRLAILKQHKIALWDVIAYCRRSGSLDSAISGERVYDFPALFEQYPNIKRLCFNGGKAHQAFLRHYKHLPNRYSNIELFPLPSTSPANARMRLTDLIDVWRPAIILS